MEYPTKFTNFDQFKAPTILNMVLIIDDTCVDFAMSVFSEVKNKTSLSSFKYWIDHKDTYPYFTIAITRPDITNAGSIAAFSKDSEALIIGASEIYDTLESRMFEFCDFDSCWIFLCDKAVQDNIRSMLALKHPVQGHG